MPATGEALELIKRIQTAQTTRELSDVMQHIADRSGFSAYAISQYVTRDGIEHVDMLLDGLPDGFGERFLTLNYGVTNPISRRAR